MGSTGARAMPMRRGYARALCLCPYSGLTPSPRVPDPDRASGTTQADELWFTHKVTTPYKGARRLVPSVGGTAAHAATHSRHPAAHDPPPLPSSFLPRTLHRQPPSPGQHHILISQAPLQNLLILPAHPGITRAVPNGQTLPPPQLPAQRLVRTRSPRHPSHPREPGASSSTPAAALPPDIMWHNVPDRRPRRCCLNTSPSRL